MTKNRSSSGIDGTKPSVDALSTILTSKSVLVCANKAAIQRCRFSPALKLTMTIRASAIYELYCLRPSQAIAGSVGDSELPSLSSRRFCEANSLRYLLSGHTAVQILARIEIDDDDPGLSHLRTVLP